MRAARARACRSLLLPRTAPGIRADRRRLLSRAVTAALTPLEHATLAALLDRLIPADEHGPGAVEAGVVDFVESALAEPLAELRGVYAQGLAAVNELATSTRGAAFAELEP